MRHWKALLPGLLAGLLVGCVSDAQTRSTSLLPRSGPWGLAQGPDMVQMEVALIERPDGDPHLNKDLWALADAQAVALERKAALDDNGFRVAHVGTLPPAELQEMLLSKQCCANPRLRMVAAGTPVLISLGPPLAQCRFQIRQDDQHLPVSAAQAQCNFVVVPSLTADGRTRLHFTPQLQYGESAPRFQPAPDRSGFVMSVEKEQKLFPDLSWEVTLAPNEYVLVGAQRDPPDSFGAQCFIDGKGEKAVQRLLVIRTTRSKPEMEREDRENVSLRRSPALALQATMTAARASRQ
jgi:hypothetical protein